MPEPKQGPAWAAPAAATPEPLASVLADMRRDARSGEHADGPLIEDYADRIEAAYKREHAEWHAETESAKDARNRIACRMRREFAEKCRNCTERAPGNAAALREALQNICDCTSCDWACIGNTEFDPCDETCLMCTGRPEEDGDCPWIQARAALAAPARNCDRYADPGKAWLAYKAECDKNETVPNMIGAISWLFAPAKGGEE